MSCQFFRHLADTGHPFILGTECDTLHLTGTSDTILRQLHLMLGTASTS